MQVFILSFKKMRIDLADQEKSGHRQRLRERFVAGEEISHTDEAILELLLSYAIPQKDLQPLIQKLLGSYGDLGGVLAADLDTLCRMDGIKSYAATLLKVTDWIRSHYQAADTSQSQVLQPVNKQINLFETPEPLPSLIPVRPHFKTPKPVVPRRGSEMFSNAVLKEAIKLMPMLPDTNSLEEIKEYLRGQLHFNAAQTRQRYANYIVRRMFPEGQADPAMRNFAKAFENNQNLREVAFYRFLKAEPLLVQVIGELLFPNLGNGILGRDKLRSYLSNRFPTFRSVNDCAQGVSDALSAGGIAKVDRLKIMFGYREIPLPAFAFVLHSEFPEPGMYDIGTIETNKLIRAMLWQPDQLLPALYELRNQGLISKVSEIDAFRQFTVRWSLAEVVTRIVAGRKLA